MSFKISLAGDLGSGKSTVSKILMEKTEAEYYSTGKICREAAAAHGMTIDEFNRYMETHPEVDKMIDDSLVALSSDPRTLIIDSRMAFHFVRDTFRVYLTTDAAVSAARILKDKRDGESFGTIEETARRVADRRKSENLRYYEKYGVHIMDMANYDLVLDTTAIPPQVVAEIILSSLKEWQGDPTARSCYLDYCRFYRAATTEETAAPLPRVFEDGGRYYLLDGVDTVLAHKAAHDAIVPCRLLTDIPRKTEGYRPLFDCEDTKK